MSRRPRLQRLELAAPAAVWGVLALALGIHLAGRAPDDMYITFRYAWNLAHGNGFVFNPGERIFGLTNPGLGLLLGGLHWVTRVPVHLLATGVYAASLWALAMLVWSEARRRGFRLEAAVGGTLVVGSTFLWLNQGSAGATVLALLAGSAVAAERRPVTAGLLAGLAVWFRPDAALGVLILGLLLWASADRGRRLPWRWGLAAAGVILAGVLVAWLWFGTLLPGTLHAKQVMADARETSWAGPTLFWARGAQFLPRHWGPAWLLVGAGGLAGLWPLAARGGRAVRALVLYGAAVAIAYPLLGVPFFSWYAVPTVVAALYGLSALACGVGRALDGHRAADPSPAGDDVGRGRSSAVRGAIRGTVVVLLLAVPVASIARVSARWLGRDTPSGRYATYREAALWIRQHTAPEERIAFGEIGNLAYWSERPVDDLMGLVTPKALPYVAARDAAGAFLALRPDVYIDHPLSPHPGLVRQPWFGRVYELVTRIQPPADGAGEVTIYRRRPGARLPPERPPEGLKKRPLDERPAGRPDRTR